MWVILIADMLTRKDRPVFSRALGTFGLSGKNAALTPPPFGYFSNQLTAFRSFASVDRSAWPHRLSYPNFMSIASQDLLRWLRGRLGFWRLENRSTVVHDCWSFIAVYSARVWTLAYPPTYPAWSSTSWTTNLTAWCEVVGLDWRWARSPDSDTRISLFCEDRAVQPNRKFDLTTTDNASWCLSEDPMEWTPPRVHLLTGPYRTSMLPGCYKIHSLRRC